MKIKCVAVLGFSLIIGANAYADTQMIDADVMRADANNDGKVSLEEFEAAHHEEMMARFKKKDINQDGFIDLEEKVVAKEKRQIEKTKEKEAERQTLREKYQKDRKRRKKHFYKYN